MQREILLCRNIKEASGRDSVCGLHAKEAALFVVSKQIGRPRIFIAAQNAFIDGLFQALMLQNARGY
jgi:hypothetical protein